MTELECRVCVHHHVCTLQPPNGTPIAFLALTPPATPLLSSVHSPANIAVYIPFIATHTMCASPSQSSQLSTHHESSISTRDSVDRVRYMTTPARTRSRKNCRDGSARGTWRAHVHGRTVGMDPPAGPGAPTFTGGLSGWIHLRDPSRTVGMDPLTVN